MFSSFTATNSPAYQIWHMGNNGGTNITLADDCAPVQYFICDGGNNFTGATVYLPSNPPPGKTILIKMDNGQSVASVKYSYALNIYDRSSATSVVNLRSGQYLYLQYTPLLLCGSYTTTQSPWRNLLGPDISGISVGSVALGGGAGIGGQNGIAIASGASATTASGYLSTAIGSAASASATSSIAIGGSISSEGVLASGFASVALGVASAASGRQSVVLGYNATDRGRTQLVYGGYSAQYAVGANQLAHGIMYGVTTTAAAVRLTTNGSTTVNSTSNNIWNIGAGMTFMFQTINVLARDTVTGDFATWSMVGGASAVVLSRPSTFGTSTLSTPTFVAGPLTAAGTISLMAPPSLTLDATSSGQNGLNLSMTGVAGSSTNPVHYQAYIVAQELV
jgi:hypothetical protein